MCDAVEDNDTVTLQKANALREVLNDLLHLL